MIKQRQFIIRDVCPQDVSLCAQIWCAENKHFLWQDPKEIHDFYQHIEGETIVVAEYAGTVVGFISAYAPNSFCLYNKNTAAWA